MAKNNFLTLLCFIFLALLSSCASSPTNRPDQKALYLSPRATIINTPPPPAFLIKNNEEQYNRIGMPSVRALADQEAEIYVDPEKPALFFEKQKFTTPRGTYHNLIYRIHFEQVPFALNKFNLTAGNNPGILFIYTLNDQDRLLLVTAVHTCGCFLSFFPTSSLPKESFPPDWPDVSQRVYGFTLPSLLPLSERHDARNIVFTLESETHRVSDVSFLDTDTLSDSTTAIDMEVFPMKALYHLPFQEKTESFFEMDGARAGYVRNNTKFFERLFISWWAFDLRVGEDKAYGSADTSQTILYTSLKFWDRKASDLKNFPRFLSYWGWNL